MPLEKAFHPDLYWAGGLNLERLVPAYSTPLGATFCMDAEVVLKAMPDRSVNLVFTSPPFALNKKKEYGNAPMEGYKAWFLPFAREIHRVLKDDGSFVLDIGGTWESGSPVRSLYQFELAIELAKTFRLAQEFYWHNPAKLPTPAQWVTVERVRVKDAVNMVWWFSRTAHPKACNRNVLRPYSESMQELLQNGYGAGKRPSGHDISRKFSTDNGGAIPSNLLEFANTDSKSAYLRLCRERGIKPHPARFPPELAEFFVRLLTDEGDLVYDPFSGSNVTGAVCERLNRRWLATELKDDYVRGSMTRFEEAAPEPKPRQGHDGAGRNRAALNGRGAHPGTNGHGRAKRRGRD